MNTRAPLHPITKKSFVQILAVREAGAVRRCHIVPHHGFHDISQHSYGAASLLLLLHPEPPLTLIKAVMWHDAGERWLGDIPATAKWGNEDLKQAYVAAEQKTLEALGLNFEGKLNPTELNWLKAVDTLDLLLWCYSEQNLGNHAVTAMAHACRDVFLERAEAQEIPGPALEFFHWVNRRKVAQGDYRLTDFFGLVADEYQQARN